MDQLVDVLLGYWYSTNSTTEGPKLYTRLRWVTKLSTKPENEVKWLNSLGS